MLRQHSSKLLSNAYLNKFDMNHVHQNIRSFDEQQKLQSN